MIGFAMCGSFCTHRQSLAVLDALLEAGEEVLPIVSETAARTDTRFGEAEALLKTLREKTGKEPITSVVDAEPLGPKLPLDALLICPCTGNTLSKIARGITDSSVTMAAKAHLRCDRPLLIALASNDALSGSFVSLATLATRKNVYFVPMIQDDPFIKPHSLVPLFDLAPLSLNMAREGKQLRPLFRCK